MCPCILSLVKYELCQIHISSIAESSFIDTKYNLIMCQYDYGSFNLSTWQARWVGSWYD
jgi:hypothetical protein